MTNAASRWWGLVAVAAAVASSGMPRPVSAGTTWKGTSTSGTASNIDRDLNWSGDVVPAFDGTDAVTFGSGGSVATVNTDVEFLGLTFTRAFTLAAGEGMLTVGAGGITRNTTGAVSIAAPLTLAADQTWSLLSGTTNTLAVTGAIGDGGAGYGLTQSGNGVLVLAGANTYAGDTTIASGQLQLDFGRAGAPEASIVSGSSRLVMGSLNPAGATLLVTGSAGRTNSQSFNGLVLAAGRSGITASATTSNTVNLALGDISRSVDGVVQFFPPANGSITTTRVNVDGILGAWALAGGDWATSAAGGGTAGAITAYTAYTDNDWAPGANTNVTANLAIAASSTTNSLRFFGTTNRTLTLSGMNEITSGGILATDPTGTGGATGNFTVTGGTIRTGVGNDFIFYANIQESSGGRQLTIASALADNGGTGLIAGGQEVIEGFTTAGRRILLSGQNTYEGRTLLLGSSVGLGGYDTGSSGPLGNGGPIEFGGGRLVYSTPINTTDYSARFTTAPDQRFHVSVGNQFSAVEWAGSLQSANGRLEFAGPGKLILTGSNAFPGGVGVTGVFQDTRSNRGNFTTLTLGSADAVGTSGPIRTEVRQGYYSKIRFTSQNTQDIGSRLAARFNTVSVLDTNGQTVTFATEVGGSQGLAKVGFGDLVLAGANTFTGALQIWGGSVVADSGSVATVLSSTASLIAGGVGSFRYLGAAEQDRVQVLPGLTLTSGQFTIDIDNPGTSTTLNLAGTAGTSPITRAAGGGAVDFRASAGTLGDNAVVRVAAATAQSNGIIGPWATVDGRDWATHTSGTILPYAGYTDVTTGTIADDATTNLRLTTGGTYSLAAPTTAAGTLLQQASSAVTIAPAGQILATAGVLAARNAGSLTVGGSVGDGSLTPATAGGELLLANFGTGPLRINSVLADNGGLSNLTTSGSGTIILAAANTISGTVAVNGGSLQIGDGGTTGGLADGSRIYLAPGATLVFNRSDDYGGSFTNVIGSSIGVWSGTQNFSHGVPWGDDYGGGIRLLAGHLTLAPSGTTNPYTTSSFTGLVLIEGGTMTMANAQALSLSPDVTFTGAGGVLQAGTTAAPDVSGRLANSTAPIRYDTQANAMTFAYPIAASNTAGFEKLGTGQLTFNAANAYLGTTTITSGTLRGAAQSFPGDVVNNATLTFTNDVLNAPGTYAGAISGGGTVLVNGTTFVPITLTGSSTFATVPVVQQGRLDIGWMAPAGQPSPLGTSGTVSLGTAGAGGLLGYSAATDLTFDRVVNLAGTTIGGGLAADGAGAFVVTSNLSVSGAGTKTFTLTGSGTAANEIRGVIPNFDGTRLTNLTKSGDGLWWVTGTNTFTGKTSITGGTLVVDRLTDSGMAGPLGAPTTTANVAIDLGSSTSPGTLRYVGTVSSTSNRVLNLTGNGTLDASGAGALVLTAANTAAAGDKTFTLTGTSTAANSIGSIAGSGVSVDKTGPGLWRLTDASTFGGRLMVHDGTIVAAAGTGLTGNGVFGPATDDALLPLIGDASDFVTGQVAVLLENNVLIDRGLVIAPLGSGATQEVILGGLVGTGTFGDGGQIRLGRDVTLQAATGGTVLFANGWQDSTGGQTPAVAFNVGAADNDGTVVFGSFLPDTISEVNVRQGTLRLDWLNPFATDRGPIGFSTPVKLGGAGLGGTLEINEGAGLGGVVLPVQQKLSNLSFDGSDSTVTGIGTLRLFNDGSAAAVNVLAGTGHTIGTALALDDAATFTVALGGRLGIAGVIADGLFGAKPLSKTGLGILELAGMNTYTGPTIISGGRLVLGENGSFANSSAIIVGDAGSTDAVLDLTSKLGGFTFGAGQTLGGGGRLQLASSGTLTVAGLFSPGNSPGLFTFDGGTTLLSGTTLMEILGPTRATLPSHGSGFYDAVDVINGGILTFGGQLQLAFGELFADTTTLSLFSAFDTASLAGNFAGVSVTGSFYSDLTWSQPSSDIWKSSETDDGHSLEFNATTGTLAIVVPEPGTLALAGLGIAAAAWAARRRR